MDGFSWVIPSKLAGMPRPRLASDGTYLRQQGIRLLVSLTEAPPDADALARHDIASIHLPVQDFAAPSTDQLDQFVSEADVAIARGRAVGVHCGAGMGRTGTFLAAYLISKGRTATEAIQEIRRLRPGSVETADQEAVLHEFEAERPRTRRA